MDETLPLLTIAALEMLDAGVLSRETAASVGGDGFAVAPFKREMFLGRLGTEAARCTVQWDGTRLSFSGTIGHGWNATHGQIILTFRDYDRRGHRTVDELDVSSVNDLGHSPAVAMLREAARREWARWVFDAWDRWHLNDLTPGSPRQEQYLRDGRYVLDVYGYPERLAALQAAGLSPDGECDGYEYGMKWLYEAVPGDILQTLLSGGVGD